MKRNSQLPYALQVLWHKWFVYKAGRRVGKIPLLQLIFHDWSKFLPAEFRVYRKRFTGGAYSEVAWKRAWLHHIHHNPHHWEHWLINGKPLPMPEIYVREMLADWMAAERSYCGNWDIQPWLNEEYLKMNLHSSTISQLQGLLASQGFQWPE